MDLNEWKELRQYLVNLRNSPEFRESIDDALSEKVVRSSFPKEQFSLQRQLFNLNQNRFITIMRHPNTIPTVRHSHDFFEVEYVRSGSIVQYINDSPVKMEAGDLIFFNKDTIHQIPELPNDTEMYHLMIDHSLIDIHFINLLDPLNAIGAFLLDGITSSEKKYNYIHIHSQTPAIDQLVVDIYNENRLYLPESNSLLRVFFLTFLILSNRLYRETQNSSALSRFSYSKGQIITQAVLDYIDQNLSTASLNSAAESLHISKNHLCTILKKVSGKTFTELHTNSKLNMAVYLLQSTNNTIDSIALQSGFESINYFYRVFKASIGVTPSQYRANTQHKYDHRK